MSANPAAAMFARHRSVLLRLLEELATRAQRSGSLRRDFVIDDLVLILLAGRGLFSAAPQTREAAARRFAFLAIDAFRAADTNNTLPRPPHHLVGAQRGSSA